MDCNEFKEGIALYLDGALKAGQEEAFQQHCDTCAACARVLEHEERYVVWLRRRLRPAPAPFELRREVMRTIRRSRRPLLIPMSVASAVAAAAVLLVFLWGPFNGGSIPAPLMAAISRSDEVALPLDVQTADPDDIRHFFSARLPFAVSLPRSATEHVTVRGGRMTYLTDAPAAVIRYEFGATPAALYVFRDSLSRSFVAAQRPGYRFIASPGGKRALVWLANGIVYALVGDVGDDQMQSLRRALTHDDAQPADPR
jgi:mycothiol system anti-sigma-R factor